MSKSSLYITVIVLLGLCSFTAVANLSKDLELQLSYSVFKDWTSQFNKQYGIEEMAIRFTNWKSNFDLVQEHNAKDLDYQLEMNHFGDLSTEEFSALHFGLNAELQSTINHTDAMDNDNDSSNTTELSALNLPKSVDWRKSGKVSHVKNQGQCGGCWAFSASGALEGLYAIKHSKLVSLSEQQMIDCAGSAYGNNGCDGGLMTGAFAYTRTYGIEADTGYKYAASAGNCNSNSKKVVFKNTGYKVVNAQDTLALKRAVAQQPVSVGIDASSSSVQLFKGGVITGGCDTGLNHGVLIVGYGTAKNGQEYWIVKNSWGAGWGDKGFFNVAMGSQNGGKGVCGINMMASYPTL